MYRSTSTTLEVTMESTNVGWLGFGFAADGSQKMIGNNAVIGLLTSPTSPFGVAQKYSLGGTDPSNVVALAQEEQTLVNATFLAGPSTEEVQGGSQLKFVKNLVDGDEVIPAEGKVRFIYAIGQNPLSLQGGHRLRSSVLLSLAPCVDFTAEQEKRARDYKRSLRIHGILAAVAFGFLVPLAIAASALRKYLDFEICCGHKAWLIAHIALNTSSFIFAVILFAGSILSKNAVKGNHFKKTHEKVGLALFILISFQVIASVFRPKTPSVAVKRSLEKSGNDPEMDTFEDEKGQLSSEPKSRARIMWEAGHKILAMAIIGMSMYQLYSGLHAYKRIFNEVDDWITAYWVWLGFALAFILFVLYKNVASLTKAR
jgi:Eukaryotic cytochrome b561.